MKRLPRPQSLVASAILFAITSSAPVYAAVDLNGRFTITYTSFPLSPQSWDIGQSGTNLAVMLTGSGSILASGTIDPDTGEFTLVDTRPNCNIPGPPGTITGVASDSDNFTGVWTTDVQTSPTICSPFTLALEGARNRCGDSVLDPGEECDGGQCCASNCRFAENGLPCSDGNPATLNDQCVEGVCGVFSNGDFAINTYTSGTQADPRVAASANGDFVVVWDSFGQDGMQNGVFAQRFDSIGSRVGTEFRVNTFTTGGQSDPTVAVDNDGFTIVWESDSNQDGSSSGIFARRYDNTGAPSGGEFQINQFTTSAQVSPSIAIDADGNTLIAWSDFGQGGIFARRYDSTGAAVGSEFLVNTTTNQAERFPQVAALGDNTFVVVWTADASSDGIRGRICDATGPLGADFVVTPSNVEFQARSAVAADPIDGNFLVVWPATVDNTLEVLGRLYGSDGSALGPSFMVNTDTIGDQHEVAVSAEPDGSFLALWSSPTDGDSSGIFAQRFANDGTRIGTEFVANTYGVGRQDRSAAAAVGSAQWVITWTDWSSRDGSGLGVFGRIFPPPTIPTPTPTTIPTPTPTAPMPTSPRYKCYQGKDLRNPQFQAVSVAATDQFNSEGLDLTRLKMICVADGGGAEALSCYSARGTLFSPQPTTDVSTQFQTSRLALKKPSLLCVPATLTVIP